MVESEATARLMEVSPPVMKPEKKEKEQQS
jgi:hypothetical protein